MFSNLSVVKFQKKVVEAIKTKYDRQHKTRVKSVKIVNSHPTSPQPILSNLTPF